MRSFSSFESSSGPGSGAETENSCDLTENNCDFKQDDDDEQENNNKHQQDTEETQVGCLHF